MGTFMSEGMSLLEEGVNSELVHASEIDVAIEFGAFEAKSKDASLDIVGQINLVDRKIRLEVRFEYVQQIPTSRIMGHSVVFMPIGGNGDDGFVGEVGLYAADDAPTVRIFLDENMQNPRLKVNNPIKNPLSMQSHDNGISSVSAVGTGVKGDVASVIP